MNENEFEYKGAIYVATDTKRHDDVRFMCAGCYFDNQSPRVCHMINCSPFNRTDNRHVIFVEKQS